MATVSGSRTSPRVGSFYIAMAAIFAIIAFTGFAPSFWLRLPSGTFDGSPMLHLHGLLFSLWTLYFLSQAILVANGRLRNHKAWGLAGIALATAMVFVGLAVAIAGLERRLGMGQGDAARAFAIVPVSSALLFGGLVTAAMANLRRPEWHKRLMLLATASLLQPAIARYFFLANGKVDAAIRQAGPPPRIEFTMMSAYVIEVLILAAVVYDWKARERLHPAYLWGFGSLLAVHWSRPLLSGTEAWQRVADFLVAFNG
ncbi:MAG TPA: hypothetical protein VFS45_03855 [Sphingomicrobium sp.]|nr:hypothetical protein [Sphingomicrobium sp.]